jgi:hypothetical protein
LQICFQIFGSSSELIQNKFETLKCWFGLSKLKSWAMIQGFDSN